MLFEDILSRSHLKVNEPNCVMFSLYNISADMKRTFEIIFHMLKTGKEYIS